MFSFFNSHVLICEVFVFFAPITGGVERDTIADWLGVSENEYRGHSFQFITLHCACKRCASKHGDELYREDERMSGKLGI